MADFSIISAEGISLTTIYAPVSQTAPTSPEYPGLPFKVGQYAQGANGTRYMFCLSTAGCTANQALGITESTITLSSAAVVTTYDAAALTKGLADQGCMFGVAVTAITATYYGWVLVSGPAYVTLKNSCLPNVPLYTTATAGMLDDTSASQTRIYGIRARDTSTASGAAKICWISNPTV
jgi:hypothetical protein